MPKRYGNLWDKICDIDNIKMAHQCAKRDKSYYTAVKNTDERLEERAQYIHNILKNHIYKVGMYKTSILYDRDKYRILFKLPYFPDRIIQWAIMLQIEPVFKEVLTNFTCASIPNRGIHYASKLTRSYIKDHEGTKYCLKFDIKKFYCMIDRKILKKLLRKKFKDKELLYELDRIVDSMEYNNLDKINGYNDLKYWYQFEGKGQPIGAYLSQYLANYYLVFFDHWLKEQLHIKYVIRYMDDIVIFSNSKQQLNLWFNKIKEYLRDNLKLEIKNNWQIFPTTIRGVDFVGYRHYPGYTLLRKKTFRHFRLITETIINTAFNKITEHLWCSYISYLGWTGWCNCYKYNNKNWIKIMPKINTYYILHKISKYRDFRKFLFLIGMNNYKKLYKKYALNKDYSIKRYPIHKQRRLKVA